VTLSRGVQNSHSCFGVFCVKIRPGPLAVASCKNPPTKFFFALCTDLLRRPYNTLALPCKCVIVEFHKPCNTQQEQKENFRSHIMLKLTHHEQRCWLRVKVGDDVCWLSHALVAQQETCHQASAVDQGWSYGDEATVHVRQADMAGFVCWQHVKSGTAGQSD